MKTEVFDYIVIGSGIAGLTSAEHLSEKTRVCLITKNNIQESATQYAQGGIAAALRKDDTPMFHLQDTIKAGAGICDEKAVQILVQEGIKRVKELIEWGAHFDKIKGEFDFTFEAAHSRRRVLHAKDKTGKEIEKTIGRKIAKEKKVVIYENCAVVKILVEDGRCIGCITLQKGIPKLFLAKAVILATGGCSQVYARNTNPPISTGDGIALAFKAGAEIQDMEFVQFHPTTLYLGDKLPISIFLISESVRGEGAILRNIYGKRFMGDYHPAAELAPRDIVARAIYQEIKRTDAPHVYLDLSNIRQNIRKRFPTIFKRCLEASLDIRRNFIPVTPAAHYCMGGIKTDYNARTSISGLYAAGEVASLGLHGANRLASNSLLDGLVFGYRAAEDALLTYKRTKVYSDKDLSLDYDIVEKVPRNTRSKVLAIKENIRNIMWEKVGIERDEANLKNALSQLVVCDWINDIKTNEVELIEVQNMLIISKLMAEFALNRKESRGGHYRIDYPERDDRIWKMHQVLSISR